MAEAVRYRVSMSRPHSHLFEVEAEFPAASGELVVALPVWTPGSYLVREYARHLQDLEAVTRAGAKLPLTRIDKRSWRIDAPDQPVILRYRVYANELTVRTSHLDASHGYFNGATLFLYSEALRHGPHRVEIAAPSGWRTFCALDQDGSAFVAPNYDDLVDSPFEVGPHEPLRFTSAGVPHEVILWGGEPYPDKERLTQELKRICDAEAQLFGGLPMKRYLFLVYLTEKGRGGLEHKASTALLFPRFGLTASNTKGWEDFLTLAAHEYFHLWNVKRIRPRALVPFDYGQESYTAQLWAFEGLTSYYDNLLCRRAGALSPQRYLTRMGETMSQLHGGPGRRAQSLAESSLTAWIKYYRQDENSPNSGVSYYTKGEIVGLLLDLEIRRLTHDAKSLDDVMRLLWQRHGDESGVPEDGFEKAASEVAGRDLTAFFDRAIRGTEELDYHVLEHVGLTANFRVREASSDKGGGPPRVKDLKPKGWLGLNTRGSQTIASVLDGSPAFEAGLYAEDEIVALDGFKVDAATLVSRSEERRPGERVRVTVFRRDRLMELEVTLGSKPADAVYLARVERPSDAQKAAFRAWLGGSLDELGPGRE
jgi:predicted metalloprotease with PDZ domain